MKAQTPVVSKSAVLMYFCVNSTDITSVNSSLCVYMGFRIDLGNWKIFIAYCIRSSCTKHESCSEHERHPNKCSAEAVADVHEHIKFIPYYQSHYSRSQNLNKTYFDLELGVLIYSMLYTMNRIYHDVRKMGTFLWVQANITEYSAQSAISGFKCLIRDMQSVW
jgi:hypothetical protein